MKIRNSPHLRWAHQTTCRMYGFSLPTLCASHETIASIGPDPGLYKCFPRPFTSRSDAPRADSARVQRLFSRPCAAGRLRFLLQKPAELFAGFESDAKDGGGADVLGLRIRFQPFARCEHGFGSRG